MTDLSYTAYLSYSHQDARWAEWLHRALEGYRVPSRLVGRDGEHGPVPRTLAPVFRDREDLSSASDLSERLQEALDASRFLIVVCSPAAAESHWVNEEIRRFRERHADERILCLLVDGEAGGKESSPFPPALMEAGAPEPLAADPRSWADGKTLARQKLISGMLGVRLDELRRRDLRRRRIWQAGLAASAVAAALLVLTTITSRMAERQERQRAEEMAGFIVDLGERLGPDLDLESMAMMSEQAVSYLDSLDPQDLSPETAMRVSLAFRQFGLAIGGQGDAGGSIEALRKSRDMLWALHERLPNDEDVLFELSQSEFYVGHHHFNRGEFDLAEPGLRAYLEHSQALLARDPEEPKYLLEASYAANGMLAWRVDGGQPVDAALLNEAQAAVKLARRAMEASDGADDATGQYATTLSWVGNTYYSACRLDELLAYRQEGLALNQDLVRKMPDNRLWKSALAFQHAGLADVLGMLGRGEESQAQRQSAIDLLSELIRRDPSNTELRKDLIVQQGKLLAQEAHGPAARETLGELENIEAQLQELYQGTARPPDVDVQLVLLELARADIAGRLGDPGFARNRLEQAGSLMAPWLEDEGDRSRYAHVIGRFRYLWWRIVGDDPASIRPTLAFDSVRGEGDYRGCDDAQLSARLAVIGDDLDTARADVAYLESRGFQTPIHIEFCRAHDLCD